MSLEFASFYALEVRARARTAMHSVKGVCFAYCRCGGSRHTRFDYCLPQRQLHSVAMRLSASLSSLAIALFFALTIVRKNDKSTFRRFCYAPVAIRIESLNATFRGVLASFIDFGSL